MAEVIQFAGESRIFLERISPIAGISPSKRTLQLRFPSNSAPPRLVASICVKVSSSFHSTWRRSKKDDFAELLNAIMKRLREIVKPAALVAALLALMMVSAGRRRNAAAWALTGGVMAAESSSSNSSWSESSCSSSDTDLLLYPPPYVYSTSNTSSDCTCNRAYKSSLSDYERAWHSFIYLLFFLTIFDIITAPSYKTIIQFQVAALDSGRTIQRDLNRIAQSGKADASTQAGRCFILEETLKSLFQHFDDCAVADSYVSVNAIKYGYMESFNSLSLKEREKFDEDTLVNINGNTKKDTSIKQTSGLSNEYTVVTILILANGTHNFPIIDNSRWQLMAALEKLQELESFYIEQLQVLWAPQDENDSLVKAELEKRYSSLRRLR